jgi:flagellar motor switch protein FliG
MSIPKILAALLVACAVALPACGNPEKKDVPAQSQNATRDQALQEIDVVRKDLIRVNHRLQTGQRKVAAEIVAQTYVGHFEKVEKVLGKTDAKLKEKLEENLSGKLRHMIKSGVAVPKLVKFVTAIDADLGRAQDELKGPG